MSQAVRTLRDVLRVLVLLAAWDHRRGIIRSVVLTMLAVVAIALAVSVLSTAQSAPG